MWFNSFCSTPSQKSISYCKILPKHKKNIWESKRITNILLLFSREVEKSNHRAACTVQFQKKKKGNKKKNHNALFNLFFLQLASMLDSFLVSFLFLPILQTLQLLQSSLFQFPSRAPPPKCFKSCQLSSIRKNKTRQNKPGCLLLCQIILSQWWWRRWGEEGMLIFLHKHFLRVKCKDDRDWGLTPELLLPFLLHVRNNVHTLFCF